MVMRPGNASARDSIALGLAIFFIAGNFVLDAAWLALPGVSLAGPCRLAAAVGRSACGPETPVDLAREALNGTITQLLEIWLLVALLRRRPERHALQLAVGSYVVYAAAIDAWLGLIAALHGMPPSVTPALPSLVVAAIRLGGHLYFVGAATLAILPYFRADAIPADRIPAAARQLRSGA